MCQQAEIFRISRKPLSKRVICFQPRFKQCRGGRGRVGLGEILVFIGTCSVTSALVSALTKE